MSENHINNGLSNNHTDRDRHIRLPLLGKMLILLLPVAIIVPMIIVGTMSIRRGVETIGQIAEQNLQLIASARPTFRSLFTSDEFLRFEKLVSSYAFDDALEELTKVTESKGM